MAPFGLKLWENTFQMIPDISFFDVEKKLTKVFEKSGVERSNPGVERNNLESGAQQPVDPNGFSVCSGGRIIRGS